jgi:hypothetical protein
MYGPDDLTAYDDGQRQAVRLVGVEDDLLGEGPKALVTSQRDLDTVQSRRLVE